MYFQCSQTSLRTTATTRSFQCWENIWYTAAGNTPTEFEESPCKSQALPNQTHILSNTAKARSLQHRNNSSSQRFRNPASHSSNQKLNNPQPGLQGSCQHKCIDPSYLYLLVWCSLYLDWNIIQATCHKASQWEACKLQSYFIKILQDQVQLCFVDIYLLMLIEHRSPWRTHLSLTVKRSRVLQQSSLIVPFPLLGLKSNKRTSFLNKTDSLQRKAWPHVSERPPKDFTSRKNYVSLIAYRVSPAAFCFLCILLITASLGGYRPLHSQGLKLNSVPIKII